MRRRTAATITDEQIRELLHAQPDLLDTAMLALHSADAELRKAARKRFAEIFNEDKRRARP